MNDFLLARHEVADEPASDGVFLESEGALVTSRWVAIGEHTCATEDVASVFVRRNEHTVAGAGLTAIGLLLTFFHLPLALAVIGLAILIAVAGAMHPVLELVVVAEGGEVVAAQAAAKFVGSNGAARLQEIHVALKRALAMPESLATSLAVHPHRR